MPELTVQPQVALLRDVGPRLALNRRQAAEALGMSVNSFERHVQPHVRVVRRGHIRLFPVKDLERWLEREAEPPMVKQVGGPR